MRSMTGRIAMISEHASPMALLGGEDSGGQNVYVEELSRALASMGYLVDVFTRRDDQKAPAVNHWAEGVRVINVDAGPPEVLKKDLLFPYMPRFRDSMLEFMEEQAIRYDLIHAHFWMSGWVGCELKSVLAIPLVQTFHALGAVKRLYQGTADTSPKERFSTEKRIMIEADTIIATCPAELEDLKTHYSVDESKVTVVPCGVNTSLFQPVDKMEARARLGLGPDERIVVYIGRILPRKDVDNIICALGSLSVKGDGPVRLVVVGGENVDPNSPTNLEIRRLRRLSSQKGVSDRVWFTGNRPQSDLKHFYSAADVCATTPWYEPFGMVPLEAMACGTPVIASDVGGLKYSVAEGETGFHVPPRNPQALAEKIDCLLSNPDLARAMSAGGITRVKRMFSWPTVAADIARRYDDLIDIYVLTRNAIDGAVSGDWAALR